jgi:hypothetical protein
MPIQFALVDPYLNGHSCNRWDVEVVFPIVDLKTRSQKERFEPLLVKQQTGKRMESSFHILQTPK